MPLELLFFNTKNHSVRFGKRELKITKHWFFVYALAAYKHLEGASIAPDDIQHLPTWERANQKSIATSVFRHLQKTQQNGLTLLTSPPGAATKEFLLNPQLEVEIAFDIPLEQVKKILKLHQPHAFKLEQPGVNARTNIALGESHFEHGRLVQSEQHFWQALVSDPSSDQKLEAWAWLAWIKIIRGEFVQAQQQLQNLHHEIAVLKKSQRLEQPEREALAWIQTGRLELNLHNWTNAHQAFDTAKRYVKAHHHREWGAILAGYSRICQNTNKLDHAYQYALQSLEHYANAKWMWAVQAMLSNLGAVCIEKSNRFTSKNPSKEHVWLTRAAQHLEHCTTLCDTSGIGTESAACEINLGHVNRRLGQTDLARGWLDRAYHLAVRAGNQFDLAMTHAETAELELQTGNKNTAITSLETALELYQCINHEAQTRVTRNRLEEVQR